MRHYTSAQIERIGGKVHREPAKPDLTANLAEKAIATMRDTVNNNEAVWGEIIKRLALRPVRFDIQRDKMGEMVSITPVYEDMK